jgi:predicted type IV restriction endonuclease/tRNA1(Val) A37 N6-methylase TrmN6
VSLFKVRSLILTKEEAKVEIRKLVQRFKENHAQYKKNSYNEAQVRKEFIDKFFRALGWDIDNEQGHAEQYKEVINEDSIKISGKTKAPDYGFRIGGNRKFFVEAKKPFVKIKQDKEPAYQLRRYSWNAKLPLSILTDFEEFSVYDCTTKPTEKDKASVARVMYFTFDQYLDVFDQIYDIFSKNAVLKGSFDRFIESTKGKRGTSEVDHEFLKEIEIWRDKLAKNIALRNKGSITVHELNHIVQITIDRILFLRICEDRSMERYERLKNIATEKEIYFNLLKYFKHADQKYNSGIFNLDKCDITTKITIDDSILKEIIIKLYYPKCPYEFTVIGTEILGNVYEQFLGKVIRLTASNNAKIEEKPEIKKAGGVFYTPQYIVSYIIGNTVGKKIKNKSPKEIEKIRIIDPACGSGTFLLGAYSYLLDYHLQYYLKNNPQKHKKDIFQVRENQWLLTSERKKKILLNNIYGIDIDPQAVEVTKLSLLLKVLEHETKESVNQQTKLIQERVLPNLSENIKCGNSLIGSEFYREVQTTIDNIEKTRRINIFDWNDSVNGFGTVMKEGKFDVIIGNPPYIQIQKLKQFYPEETDFYQRSYETAKAKNVDIYIPFIEKSLKLLKKDGLLGFICPNRFFNSDYGKNLRDYIKNYNLYHLVNFRHYFVFKNADTYTCLLFLQNKKQKKSLSYKEIRDLYKNKSEKISYYLNNCSNSEDNLILDEISPSFLNKDKWYFMTQSEEKIFNKITKNKKFSSFYDINFQGLITGMDKVFILELIKQKEKMSTFYSKELCKEVELENDLIFNIVGNSDIQDYSIKRSNNYIIFPYKKGKIMEEAEIKKYPLIWKYLNIFKNDLRKREKKIGDKKNGKFENNHWYRFSRNQAIDKQELSKILIPHVVDKTKCAYDNEGKTFIKNVGVNGVRIKDSVKEEEEYFMAILNSPIANFFISKTSIFLSGGFYATNKQFAGEIPIKNIDFKKKEEKQNYEKIIKFVDGITNIKERMRHVNVKSQIDIFQRQIISLSDGINESLYQLYGLTKEEIKIIEDSLK